MTNAQTNLAGLGTKPIQLNVGEIFLNQMNYLSERKGREEAAKAQAQLEREKRKGDIINKNSVLDYKNVPDYILNQYNKAYTDAINDNTRIARELQGGLIDETEAIRQYALNKNIPEQIASFSESVKKAYEQMRDGDGDPILNAEREDFLKSVASGGFALKRGDDGSQQIVLKNEKGEEEPYTMSQVGMLLNYEKPFYDKEYDTQAFAKTFSDNAKMVKTDNGYVMTENIKFEDSRPNILNAVKSTGGSYKDFPSWTPEMKKAYKEMYGTYAKPTSEEDANKFYERFTDERVRVFFDEKQVKSTDPLMAGKVRGQELENQGKALSNQGKKIANQRGKVALKKETREENELRPIPTIGYVNDNNWDKGKGGLKSGVYAFPKGKEYTIWLDDDNPEYKVKNVMIRDGGRLFVEKDGVKGKEQIEITNVSDKNSVSVALGRDGWDQLYTENQDFIKEDPRPSRTQPNKVSAIVQKANQGIKKIQNRYFSGGNKGGGKKAKYD